MRLIGLEKWHECETALMVFHCSRELVALNETVAPTDLYIQIYICVLNLHMVVSIQLCIYPVFFCNLVDVGTCSTLLR